MGNHFHNFCSIIYDCNLPSTSCKSDYAPDTKGVNKRDPSKCTSLIDDPPFFVRLKVGIKVSASGDPFTQSAEHNRAIDCLLQQRLIAVSHPFQQPSEITWRDLGEGP